MNGSSITKGSIGVDYDHVPLAPVRLVTYRCASGHAFDLRFAAEADEIPVEWGCRCGVTAVTTEQDAIAAKVSNRPTSGGKTPYQMLRERRTEAELEVLLEERLEILRARTAAGLDLVGSAEDAVPDAMRQLAAVAAA